MNIRVKWGIFEKYIFIEKSIAGQVIILFNLSLILTKIDNGNHCLRIKL